MVGFKGNKKEFGWFNQIRDKMGRKARNIIRQKRSHDCDLETLDGRTEGDKSEFRLFV